MGSTATFGEGSAVDALNTLSLAANTGVASMALRRPGTAEFLAVAAIAGLPLEICGHSSFEAYLFGDDNISAPAAAISRSATAVVSTRDNPFLSSSPEPS